MCVFPVVPGVCSSPPVWECWRIPGGACKACMAAWRTTSRQIQAERGRRASQNSSPPPQRATLPQSDWSRSGTSSVEGEKAHSWEAWPVHRIKPEYMLEQI